MCLVGWISQCGGASVGSAIGRAIGGALRGALGGALRAPSEAAAPADPFAVFRDDTLKPTVDQVTTALPQFADAFTAAAASDATDTDKIVFGDCRLQAPVALESGAAILAEAVADLPECGVEAQTQAQGFFATLTEDSKDLLAETTANPDQADAVTELVEKAATSATELTTALDQACA